MRNNCLTVPLLVWNYKDNLKDNVFNKNVLYKIYSFIYKHVNLCVYVFTHIFHKN